MKSFYGPHPSDFRQMATHHDTVAYARWRCLQVMLQQRRRRRRRRDEASVRAWVFSNSQRLVADVGYQFHLLTYRHWWQCHSKYWWKKIRLLLLLHFFME